MPRQERVQSEHDATVTVRLIALVAGSSLEMDPLLFVPGKQWEEMKNSADQINMQTLKTLPNKSHLSVKHLYWDKSWSLCQKILNL